MTEEFTKDDLIVEIWDDEPYRVLGVYDNAYFLSGTKYDRQHAFGLSKDVAERDFVKVGRWKNDKGNMGD